MKHVHHTLAVLLLPIQSPAPLLIGQSRTGTSPLHWPLPKKPPQAPTHTWLSDSSPIQVSLPQKSKYQQSLGWERSAKLLHWPLQKKPPQAQTHTWLSDPSLFATEVKISTIFAVRRISKIVDLTFVKQKCLEQARTIHSLIATKVETSHYFQ